MRLCTAFLASLIVAAVPAAAQSPVPSPVKKPPASPMRTLDLCTAPQVGKTTRVTSGEGKGLGLAGDINRRWADRTTLKVAFMGGTPQARELVEHYAKMWGYYANLYFDFGDFKDADIRVAFEPKGQWHSTVGKDAQDVPRNAPTMVLGIGAGPTDREAGRRHTLHEFGHAIGFIHEHQSPKAGIPWNEKRVIEDCKRDQGWTDKQTRHNIFEMYKSGSVNASTFDPKSIMLYAFPKEWTTNGFATAWNTELSEMDKRHAARLYPWTPHSLIRIHNHAGKTLTIKRRWKGTEPWYTKTMDAGDYYDFWQNAGPQVKATKIKGPFGTNLSVPAVEPRFAAFEIQFDSGGKTVTQTLASTAWRPKQESDYPDFSRAAGYAFVVREHKVTLVKK